MASKESLTEGERKKLDSLNKQVGEYDFTSVVRDPLYEPFVRAMSVIEKEKDLQEIVLTKEQQEYRKKLAIDILRRIKTNMENET